MDRVGQILGKTLPATATNALSMLASALCEGILLSDRQDAVEAEHLFGRKAVVRISDQLSYLAGMASGGLRTTALLRPSDLLANLTVLQTMVRHHTPTVVLCKIDDPTGGMPDVNLLKNTGCFILLAGSAQEAIELMVIAHRIAELSLVPGILLFPVEAGGAELEEVRFPAAPALIELLGSPDDVIPAPTPAQEMLFGKNRRRIPNWYHFDQPALTGIPKSGITKVLEQAASDQYFTRHLPEIIHDAFLQAKKASFVRAQPLSAYRETDADYLLFGLGFSNASFESAVDVVRAEDKARVGAILLRQLAPLPAPDLARLLPDKKAVTWLEPGATFYGNPFLSDSTWRALLDSGGKRSPQFFRGFATPMPNPGAIATALRNMLPQGARESNYVLDIPFTRPGSEFPQHEILLQTIRRLYSDALPQALVLPDRREETVPAGDSGRLPWTVRRQKDLGPPYARITRFYHDTGALYASGAEYELVADPFQAIPSIPAGTAGLMVKPESRTELPVFLPEKCTGCGDCLVYCPHAALPPLALTVEQMLRAAMEVAGKKGTPVTQLTPLLKNLGILSGQMLREREAAEADLVRILPEAFARLADQTGMDAEKRERVGQEIAIVAGLLSPLSLAVTTAFFEQPEALEKGKGALFTLALDAQACTGCGVCSRVCVPEALVMQPETATARQTADDVLALWEQLPDTPADVVARQLRDPEYDSLAAVLLSRYNYLTQIGSGPDSHAPSKTMLHALTAVTESVMQPRMAARYKEIETLIASLSENIRKNLAEALPSEDSLGLISAIAGAGGRKLPLDEIIGKLGTLEHLKLVDTEALQRKISLVNDLKDLLWLLREGPSGMGRSRYGLAFLGNNQDLVGKYPFQSFQVPVLAMPSGSPDLGLGLFDAYLRHAIDNIRLLRRAQLEIKNQYRPEFHDAVIAGLTWTQLSAEEKDLIPPLLLIGDQADLPSNFVENLLPLLTQDRPLKVVLLDHGAPEPETVARSLAFRSMLLDLGRASRNAFVFMGSLAARQPLFDALVKGLGASRPALFLLQAPVPDRHKASGLGWTRLPALALHSRAFPICQFDPEKAGQLLSAGMSLEANPADRENWPVASLTYREGQEEKVEQVGITYADWLFTLNSWSDHFTPLAEHDSDPIALDHYLGLDPGSRESKKPVLYRVDPDGVRKGYSVSARVVQATEAALSAWNQLRETAGALSRHPQKLWEEAQAALAQQYEEKIRQLQDDFDARMREMEQNTMQKVRVQLREKLLQLSRAAAKRQEETPHEN